MQISNSFKVLNDNQLLDINGGECITQTVSEHPIKFLLFGMIYVAGVAYGCYA